MRIVAGLHATQRAQIGPAARRRGAAAYAPIPVLGSEYPSKNRRALHRFRLVASRVADAVGDDVPRDAARET